MLIRFLSIISAVLILSACSTTKDKADGVDSSSNGSAYGVDGSNLGTFQDIPGSETGAKAHDRVFFEYDSSVLSSDAQATLDKQIAWLGKNTDAQVTIEGHCDERGTREYNLALGERRANSVKKYLVSSGVDASRVTTTSYGKERPAVVGSSSESWAENRRGVTIVK
jgi:peptidoglycan-associated lipoprotein